MKIYVINLDHERQRWNEISAQLEAQGADFERFPAVCGANLTDVERKRSVNSFRWRCAVGQPPTVGEMGCALSHYGVYQKVINKNEPYVCILEDDAVLAPNFMSELKRLEQILRQGKGARVVLLTDKLPSLNSNMTPGIYPVERETGAFGYVVTLEAAYALSSINFPIKVPFDWWYRWRRSGKIDVRKLVPAICDYNRSCQSGTTPGRIVLHELPLWRRLEYRLFRALGMALDAVLP